MSFKAMLELANVQQNVETLADAIAMTLDNTGLHTSTDVLSENALRVVVASASTDEVIALVHNYLDIAGSAADSIEVTEAADGNGAIVIFNDPEGVATAQLETAGVIFERADTINDEDDEEDETHMAEEDDDVEVDDDDDEDDADADDDPHSMKVLHDEEGFKLASRLQQMACGPSNKADFPYFLKELDTFMRRFRNRSGYDPAAVPEQASTEAFETFTEELALAIFTEEAKGKKKGFRKGRSGFLSAYMTIISKNGDELAEAWDSLDTDSLTSALSDCGAQLLDIVDDERVKQGLESKKPFTKDGKLIQPEDLEEGADVETATIINK